MVIIRYAHCAPVFAAVRYVQEAAAQYDDGGADYGDDYGGDDGGGDW